MKLIQNPIPIEEKKAIELSKELNIDIMIIKLLLQRGIDTKEKIDQFLYPSDDCYYDPMLLKDMNRAKVRLQELIDRKEKLVVFGDYDCDGVVSAAILESYFESVGVDTVVYLPSRDRDGYGLSIGAIEEILENHNPDLILTCDCGISAVKEISYCFDDLGVEVIVTDHHEPASILPNCIIVNPKQVDCTYPNKNLCGAGVALKLIQALGGKDKSFEYIDIAAVATVADMVDLIGENRYIVQKGLQKINSDSCNVGLKALIKSINNFRYAVGSDLIAYKVAPKINVLGRMGDAYDAYRLLVIKDNKQISNIIDTINIDNEKRKKLCEEQYQDALVDLKDIDIVNNKGIVLANPALKKGLTGILAARIASEFCRTTFILAGLKDGIYKGTSRCVDGINLYELLSSVSDLLVEFGGHKQAAGFSIKEENVKEFEKAINKKLASTDNSLYVLKIEYDLCIDYHDINERLVCNLDMLAPFGMGNHKPVFKIETNRMGVSNIKNSYSIFTCDNGFEIMSFCNTQDEQFTDDDKKELAIEIDFSIYQGEKKPKGMLKGISRQTLGIDIQKLELSNIWFFTRQAKTDAKFQLIENNDIVDVIGNNFYGTLIVASTIKQFDFIKEKNIPLMKSFLHSRSLNNISKIFLSPYFDDLHIEFFDKIIFLDSTVPDDSIAWLHKKTNAKIYKVSKKLIIDDCYNFFDKISSGRDKFVLAHRIFSSNQENKYKDIFDCIKTFANNYDIMAQQLIFCLAVFEELGIIEIKSNFPFSYSVNNKKNDLNNSKLYCSLSKNV